MKKLIVYLGFIGINVGALAVVFLSSYPAFLANAQAAILSYPVGSVAPTSYPTSYPASYPVAKSAIQITELYPSPDSSKGEEEWVEIFNYSDSDLKLKGMYFKERASSGSGYASTISNLPDDVIKAKDYYLIKGSLLKVSLNNSGDEITLFDSTNQIVDAVKYDPIATSISYSRVYDLLNKVYTNEFRQNEVLTPLEENRFAASTEIVYLDIKSIKALPAGTAVSTIGIVTVEKDLLGDTQFYIQDATGGIKVDLASTVEFSPELWTRLKLTGEISQASGEIKLNIKRAEDLSVDSSSAPLAPLNLTSGMNLDSKLGMLVSINGPIINNYSTSFDVNSAAGQIRVSILSSTNIDIPEKSKGDTVFATGILVKSAGIFKVLPRYQSDISLSPLTLLSKSSGEASSSIDDSTDLAADTAARVMSLAASKQSTLTLPSTTIHTLPLITDNSLTIELWPIFVMGIAAEGVYLLWRNRVLLKEITSNFVNAKLSTLKNPGAWHLP